MQDIQEVNGNADELRAALQKQTLSCERAERQLVEEQHAAASKARATRSQINELEISIDVERARQLEITK